MSEPVRIILRLVGVVLLLGGIGLVVMLFVPGPADVADWMGENCSHGTGLRESEPCTVTDVIEIALLAPVAILIGFVLTIALRPPGRGPITLDFSRRG